MSYEPTVPKWVKITKTFSDFSAAALTNSITIFSLPAKAMILGCEVIATTLFSGGVIATYTISVGISGSNAKYALAQSVFTGASVGQPNTLVGIESTSASTNITATAISTVGNLNAATAGSVDIYLLVSQLN